MSSANPTVKWGTRPRQQKPRTEASQALDAFVRSKRITKRLNVDISVDLHTRVKAGCALEGRDMTTVVTELLEQRFPG